MNSHLITRSDWMIFNQCSECGVRGVVQIDRLSAAGNECACPAILGRVRRRSQQWGALGCGRCRGLCWCWQWSEAGLGRCKEANSAHTYLELEPCGAWMSVLWCHYTNKQGKTDADQKKWLHGAKAGWDNSVQKMCVGQHVWFTPNGIMGPLNGSPNLLSLGVFPSDKRSWTFRR